MLEGKTLAVTGARGALGSATVERAQALGAEVIGIDIVPAEGAANYLQLDLTDRGATAEALAGLDKLDGLLNIAGGFAMGTAAAEPTDVMAEHKALLERFASSMAAMAAAAPGVAAAPPTPVVDATAGIAIAPISSPPRSNRPSSLFRKSLP